MRPRALLLLFVPLVTAGCFPWYTDNVNGEDDNFSFVGASGSVPGEALDLWASHSEAAALLCVLSRDGSCSTLAGGDQTPITEVLSADCDDGACRVEEQDVDKNGVVHVSVVGLRAGRTNLNLRTRLSDGREMSDRWSLTFLPATRLAAYCFADATDESGVRACAGRYAIFPGATVTWNVRAENASGDATTPLHAAQVTASVDGDAVAIDAAPAEPSERMDESTFPYWTLTLRAVKPGLSTVHLAGAGIARDIPIRVASAGDVVDATLVGARRDDEDHWVDAADDPTVGVDTALTYGSRYGYAVVLTLSDGSRALGGAGFTRASGPLYEFGPLTFDGADDPVKQLAATELLLDAEHRGAGTVTFDFGAIHRAWPITVEK